jgi:hypothetical protein
MVVPPTLSVHFVDQGQVLFSGENVSLVVCNDYSVQKLRITLQFVLLNLELVLGNKLKDQLILFGNSKVLPLLFVA